jgi:uncharacterized cupin superfamily protein
VVTGTDAQGRSRVLWDGPAPNVNPGAVSPGAGMTDVWVFEGCPAVVTGERDDGNLPFNFEPPEHGGHLRIVQSRGRPTDYDPAKDPRAVAVHEARQRPGGTWDRGGQNAYSSPIHKSATVDYGILLAGERVLRLDDGEHVMHPGDVVVQLGNWHGWTNPRQGSLMAFVMMGGTFDDVDAAPDPPAWRAPKPPDGVRLVRRIVTIDDERGQSRAIQDGPCPDVRTDPARPGYSSARIWVTDRTPARIQGVRETLHLPHALEPPPGGSLCRIVTLPPDRTVRDRVGAREIAEHFAAMGSPGASTHSSRAPHPYMQKTRTLDLCLVLDGEVTLVLDTSEVSLTAGDTVIQRATNHAWSNVSPRPAVIAISSHDARA